MRELWSTNIFYKLRSNCRGCLCYSRNYKSSRKEISGIAPTTFARGKCRCADDVDVQEYMKLTKIKETEIGDIICAHSPFYSPTTPLIKVMFQLLKHDNEFCYMIEGSVITLPNIDFGGVFISQSRCLPANVEEIKEYMKHKTV